MAWVYLATDLKHGCEVAIKVLKPDLSASLRVDRFLEEIRTTARLQHPHILPLFDSGEAGDLLFCVMPFVDGESLYERIKRERQLPIDEAIRIRAGVTIGTPLYMSPEQAGGDETIGWATDIFSLACVLYEMPVGTTPYPGNTPQAVAGKILSGSPPTQHRGPQDDPHQCRRCPAARTSNVGGRARRIRAACRCTGLARSSARRIRGSLRRSDGTRLVRTSYTPMG